MCSGLGVLPAPTELGCAAVWSCYLHLLNWDVQRSGRVACTYRPDWGDTFLRNAGTYLPNYTVSSQRSLCSTVQFMFSLKCKESELLVIIQRARLRGRSDLPLDHVTEKCG